MDTNYAIIYFFKESRIITDLQNNHRIADCAKLEGTHKDH